MLRDFWLQVRRVADENLSWWVLVAAPETRLPGDTRPDSHDDSSPSPFISAKTAGGSHSFENPNPRMQWMQ